MYEEFRDVVGYEGLYKVSNLGNVYSCYTNRMLSPGTTLDGYMYVGLRKNKQRTNHFIHRLVAQAFISNPDNLPIINHIDENPKNNCVSNLEWCNYIYNATYNDAHIKRGLAMSKHVYAYNNNCELVYEFDSARKAAKELCVSSGRICTCCNSNNIIYKNMVWSYFELSKEEVLRRFEIGMKTVKNNIGVSKKVNQLDLDRNFICSYPSVGETSRKTGIASSSISRVCTGKQKQTHGFIFEYKNDDIG